MCFLWMNIYIYNQNQKRKDDTTSLLHGILTRIGNEAVVMETFFMKKQKTNKQKNPKNFLFLWHMKIWWATQKNTLFL